MKIITEKTCTKCFELKSIEEFSNSKRGLGGKKSYCKQCFRKHMNSFNEANRERINLERQIRRANFPKETKEKLKRYKQSEKGKANSKQYKNLPKVKFYNYKSRAKRRNLSFDLTFEEFESFWQKSCTYCGNTIETIGLDRIDNNIGYNIINCVSCCKHCNTMKLNFSKDQFLNHILKIYNFSIKQEEQKKN